MASRSLTLLGSLVALAFTCGVATAQVGQLTEFAPGCQHIDYRGNFRLNGAKQHLDVARSTTYADVRKSQVGQALSLLDQASHASGIDQTALWYLYADVYTINNDAAGADSAFTKIEPKADADCMKSIQRERRNLWVPLQNAGVELMNAGAGDSALVLFRQSNRIFRTEPYSFLNMAQIFYGKQMLDSAAAYFKLAAHSTTEHRFDEARATALFDAARLDEQSAEDSAGAHAAAQRRGVADSVVKAERLTEAENTYRELLQMRPRDMAAQASLAGVYTEMHQADLAKSVYDSMLAHSDSAQSEDLFTAGVALFRAGNYALAGQFIERGLRTNQCSRDGLFNLANTYMAAKDTARLLAAAQHLIQVDSMHRSSLQLLARAWQDAGNKDSTLHVLQRAEALPWEFSVVRFDETDTTASLHGMVTNQGSQPLKGFNLVVHFVNGACQEVASKTVEIPDLNPNGNAGQAYDFTVDATGKGIVAWKYGSN